MIVGDIHTGENSIEGSYNTFSGNYFKKVELDKNDKINFELTAEPEAGSSTAQLIDPEGNKILEIKEGSQKEKIINESGKYKIKVIGKDHKGNFKFKWISQYYLFYQG